MSAPIDARNLRLNASEAAPKSVVDAIERELFDVNQAVSLANEIENERMGSAAQGIIVGAAISVGLWVTIGAAVVSCLR